MPKSDPIERLEVAIELVSENDKGLFERDVNERSVTHRLGLYLTPLFPKWDVDCEYNREGHDSKRIVGDTEDINSGDIYGRTVYPDVIVHERGVEENLLVVEAKLSSNRDGLDSDIVKLEQFVERKEYQYAAAVLFQIDTPSDSRIEWKSRNP